MADQSLTRRVTYTPDNRMNLDFICAPPVPLHDFNNNGVCSSDWELSVKVTQSHDEDDENGEVIEPHAVEHNARRYQVVAGRHVRVSIRNESTAKIVEFQPVYVDETGYEWSEGSAVKLAPLFTAGGYGVRELPCLPKDYCEDETSWLLKDLDGRHVLRLHFTVEQ